MPGFSEQCGVAKRIARVVAQSYGSVVSSGVWMCVPSRLVRAELLYSSIILCILSFVCYVNGFRLLYCLASVYVSGKGRRRGGRGGGGGATCDGACHSDRPVALHPSNSGEERYTTVMVNFRRLMLRFARRMIPAACVYHPCMVLHALLPLYTLYAR